MRAVLAAVGVAAACGLAGTAGAEPPKVDARAWLVENPVTGDVLARHAERYQVPIASITKLMTVIVALQHLKLSDVVTVDPRAAAVGQESVFLEPRQRITVADLVRAALIQSANDAADALALATAPSYPAFADLMNAQAAGLGLTDSHFVRPDGLDAPGEGASARDVTRLAAVAMALPAVRAAVRRATASLADGTELHTWNDLLGVVPGVYGIKTGHTDDAGWSEVAAIHRGGTTIYATILGSPTRTRRNADLEALLAYGVNQYRRVDAVAPARGYASVRLPYGRAPLRLVALAPLQAVVRVGRPLTERVVAPTAAALPIRRGQVLGHVQVWDGDRLLGSRALVASRSVGKPGVAGRVGWYARRTVHNVLGLVTP
jgi:serine-type D-Ala-D-Ala carboxypeptidase (penicillin-binding protein 5/6)